ncbi:MAG TPA: hypothetical protein PL020_07385 [Candidatus Cloacimonadota bacterium]|nr:hypothetical protein [Candidatus Cloacimonadota bacterium]
MLDTLISTRSIKTIALVGISKNSGKTTLLNGILKHAPQIKWAVMSTGLDGETSDRLYKTPKPRVFMPQGALYCADSSSLDHLGSRVRILSSELYSGRKLWILQAEEDLETEITGPSNVSDQICMAKELLALGATKVLIDGSLDRKSIAFEDSVHAIILCVGASFGTKEEVSHELKRMNLMINIPQSYFTPYRYKKLRESGSIAWCRNQTWQRSEITSLIGHEKQFRDLMALDPEAVYIPTAYTSLLHARLFPFLKGKERNLIFRHPQCISLSYRELIEFRRDCRVSCLIPFRVKLYALNPWSVARSPEDATEFRYYIRKMHIEKTFIDIMEL